MTTHGAARSALVLLGVAVVSMIAIGPSATRMADAQSTTTRLSVVRQTAFVGPEGTFSVELANQSLPADARLSLTLYAPIGSRAQFDRSMTDEQPGAAIITTPAVTPVAGATTTVLSLRVSSTWPAPSGGVVVPTAGVHPVSIEAARPDGTRLARLVTSMIRLPAATAPTTALGVGTITHIDAAPLIAFDGSATLTSADATRSQDQFALVDDLLAPPVAIAASPFVLSTLRASGTPIGPGTALRAPLSLPWVSIDTVSLLAAGQEAVVADEYRSGDAVLASLFAVEPDRAVTLVDGSTSPRALDLAAARGARSAIVGSVSLRSRTATTDPTVPTERFTIRSENGTPFAAIAADDGAAAALADGTDPVLAAHRALAALAMLHFDQPAADHGVAIVVPPSTTPDALREFLIGIGDPTGTSSGSAGSAILAPVSLANLFTSTTTTRGGPVVRDWTRDDPVGTAEWTTVLDQTRWDLRGLETLLPDAPELTEPIGRSILTSADRSLTTPGRLAVLANAERSIRELTRSITLPGSQGVTLTSASGDLPLTIENSLPATARVRVTVRSPKLDFPDGSTFDVDVAPGTTRTTVRVITRSSGAFPTEVSITSPDGVLLVASARIEVRSTAISGLGLVLSISAGLFLAVWWIRHFRHTRRARSLIERGGAEPGSAIAD